MQTKFLDKKVTAVAFVAALVLSGCSAKSTHATHTSHTKTLTLTQAQNLENVSNDLVVDVKPIAYGLETNAMFVSNVAFSYENKPYIGAHGEKNARKDRIQNDSMEVANFKYPIFEVTIKNNSDKTLRSLDVTAKLGESSKSFKALSKQELYTYVEQNVQAQLAHKKNSQISEASKQELINTVASMNILESSLEIQPNQELKTYAIFDFDQKIEHAKTLELSFNDAIRFQYTVASK